VLELAGRVRPALRRPLLVALVERAGFSPVIEAFEVTRLAEAEAVEQALAADEQTVCRLPEQVIAPTCKVQSVKALITGAGGAC
jgi:hypothetical protein